MIALIVSSLLFLESSSAIEHWNKPLFRAFDWIENEYITGVCTHELWGDFRAVFWFHCLGYQSNRYFLQRYDSLFLPHHPLRLSVISRNFEIFLYLLCCGYRINEYDLCFEQRTVDTFYITLDNKPRFSLSKWLEKQLFTKTKSKDVLYGIDSELWNTITAILSHDYSDARFQKIVFQNRVYDVGQKSLSSLPLISLRDLYSYSSQTLSEYYTLGSYEMNLLKESECRCLYIRLNLTSPQKIEVDAVYYRTEEDDYYRFINGIFWDHQGYWIVPPSFFQIVSLESMPAAYLIASPEERRILSP